MASITIIPNGYTHTGSYNFTWSTGSSTKIENAYNNADHTSSSARLQVASSRTSTRTSALYFEFDKSAINNIPDGSTIDSIAANVRYYVSSNTYITAVSFRLYSNTTAKGTAVSTRTNSSEKYSITPGTWTLNELKNIRLYLSASHNASTTAAYVYVYGADVTINYTEPAPAGPTNVRVKQNGVWVTPRKLLVKQNGSWVESTAIKVKDNGTWK